MNTTFWKGAIMLIVAALASAVSNHTLPSTGIEWEIFAIAIFGTELGYLAKNWIHPSTSAVNSWNWQDALSGVMIAVASGISDWLATVVTHTQLDWKQFGTYMIGVMGGYFIKTFIQPAAK